MGIIAGIVVGWATNAAWIEDHWAIGQLNEVLLVAVSAQDYVGLDIAPCSRIVVALARTSRRSQTSSTR